MTNVTEINYDIDGSIMSVCETVTLTEGIKVEIYTMPGESKPHEIALYIGDAFIEMNYSDEVAEMLGRLDEVSALELLAACHRNLWQMKGEAA